MKKTIFLLVFFLINLSLFSQSFIKYNQLVNKAELSIIDSNYTKALYYYQDAFKLVEYPFAKDLYNALLCATFTNNFDIAFEYLYKLVHKGIEYENFAKNKYLNPLKEDKRWFEFEKYYYENRKKILAGFNQDLKAEFERMLEEDQKSNKARKKDPNKRYKFDSTVFANTLRIKEIIQLYGFPTEEMLGVNDFTDAPFESALLFHYFQISKQKNIKDSINIMPYLIEAIKNGKLNYSLFFNYLEDISLNKYGSNLAYLIDTNIVFIKIDSNSIAIINKNRKLLGIETLEESQTKVKYYIKKIFKPRPIKKGEKEYDYMISIYDNIDTDFFIIGRGLFSHFIYKYEDVDKFLDFYRNQTYNIKKNE